MVNKILDPMHKVILDLWRAFVHFCEYLWTFFFTFYELLLTFINYCELSLIFFFNLKDCF